MFIICVNTLGLTVEVTLLGSLNIDIHLYKKESKWRANTINIDVRYMAGTKSFVATLYTHLLLG
jgi:hypothetical protein